MRTVTWVVEAETDDSMVVDRRHFTDEAAAVAWAQSCRRPAKVTKVTKSGVNRNGDSFPAQVTEVSTDGLCNDEQGPPA